MKTINTKLTKCPRQRFPGDRKEKDCDIPMDNKGKLSDKK